MTIDIRRLIMTIAAGVFKSKCLQLMDDVQKYHKEIIITKFGKPVAKLVAIDEPEKKSIFGCMKGTVTFHGDIMAPIDVEWNANA